MTLKVKKDVESLTDKFKDMPLKELKRFMNVLKENDLDRDKVDLMALDCNIGSCEEMIEAVSDNYHINLIDHKSEAEKMKAVEEQMKHEAGQKAIDETEAVVDAFKKSKPKKQIRIKSFEIPRHYIRMIVEGYSYGTILIGPGGLGKSWLAMNEVRRHLKNNQWEFLSGHVTPMALYQFVYEHNGKVIILDDIKNLLKNELCVSLLKGLLWPQESGDRIICWESTAKLKDGIPTRFICTSRFIILANSINDGDPDIAALESRCNYHNVELTINEVLTIMRQIISMPYKKTTIKQRQRAYKMIENRAVANPAILNFNLRMLVKTYDCVAYKGKDDEVMDLLVDDMLKKDDELSYIFGMIDDDIRYSSDEMCVKFQLKFDRSRRTYFRKKKILLKMIGKKEGE